MKLFVQLAIVAALVTPVMARAEGDAAPAHAKKAHHGKKHKKGEEKAEDKMAAPAPEAAPAAPAAPATENK